MDLGSLQEYLEFIMELEAGWLIYCPAGADGEPLLELHLEMPDPLDIFRHVRQAQRRSLLLARVEVEEGRVTIRSSNPDHPEFPVHLKERWSSLEALVGAEITRLDFSYFDVFPDGHEVPPEEPEEEELVEPPDPPDEEGHEGAEPTAPSSPPTASSEGVPTASPVETEGVAPSSGAVPDTGDKAVAANPAARNGSLSLVTRGRSGGGPEALHQQLRGIRESLVNYNNVGRIEEALGVGLRLAESAPAREGAADEALQASVVEALEGLARSLGKFAPRGRGKALSAFVPDGAPIEALRQLGAGTSTRKGARVTELVHQALDRSLRASVEANRQLGHWGRYAESFPEPQRAQLSENVTALAILIEAQLRGLVAFHDPHGATEQ